MARALPSHVISLSTAVYCCLLLSTAVYCLPCLLLLSVYDGLYHTPRADYPWLISPHSRNTLVSVPIRSALGESRRELSEDASFGIGTLLSSNRAWKNRPSWVGFKITPTYALLLPPYRWWDL